MTWWAQGLGWLIAVAVIMLMLIMVATFFARDKK